jgi:hypothetical protein
MQSTGHSWRSDEQVHLCIPLAKKRQTFGFQQNHIKKLVEVEQKE